MSAPQQLSEQQRNRLQTAHHSLPRREMVRYWLLSADDIRRINERRREHNRLGFAVQLCLLRYPGWPLRAGEKPPNNLLEFVATLTGTYHWQGRQSPWGRFTRLHPDGHRALQGYASLAWYFCQSVRSGLVAKLLSAGAVALGKTNMHELAYIAVFSGGGNRAGWEEVDAAMRNQKLRDTD